MPKAKKANVDIAAVAVVMRRALIVAGGATVLTCAALQLLGLRDYTLLGMIIPIFVVLGIASVKVQRYDHNKRSWLSRNLATILISSAALFVSITLIRDSKPASISIEGDILVIEGSYGTATPLEQIESVELLTTLPKIAARVNGLDTGVYLRGNFRFKDSEMGICRIFVKPHCSPYVYVKRAEGKDIIFNTPDSITTLKLYKQLEHKIKPQD